MRLIDADALKAEWGFGDRCDRCEAECNDREKEPLYTKSAVCDMIDDAPTVETKDTVGHCRDCMNMATGIVTHDGRGRCGYLERLVWTDDYCSYYARKVTEEDGE